MSYAKGYKAYNYEGTIKYNLKENSGLTESLTSKMNLEDGVYYFTYIELDDEKGVYYPVEDIALYRAKGTTDLIKYSDEYFVWNIEEPKQEKEDTTQAKGKILQTGEEIIYTMMITIFVISSILGYIKYKKHKDI